MDTARAIPTQFSIYGCIVFCTTVVFISLFALSSLLFAAVTLHISPLWDCGIILSYLILLFNCFAILASKDVI